MEPKSQSKMQTNPSTLKIHTLMHVPYEGLGCIENWIENNNHTVSYTKFYENFTLPSTDNFDWLIVMGGPMGVYDEELFAWLVEEKTFIKQAIESGKTVIGICLGSQLIAEVLGAKVYPNKQKEIGWWKIKKTEVSKNIDILKDAEDEFTVFHWHGDTYDLPEESVHLFSSDVCKNQAFLYKEKVLGLQFHFEVTPKTLSEMVVNGQSELIECETVQSEIQILEQSGYFENSNNKMFQILDKLFRHN